MGILDDDSLDERATPIIAKTRGEPSVTLFERAAMIEASPSPQTLQSTAWWLEIVEDLAAAGFTPEQILRVALRVNKKRFGVAGPTAWVLRELFAIDAGLDIARALGDELLALDSPTRSWQEQALANVALTRLAAGNAIEPRFETLFDLAPMQPDALRAIVGSLPGERREEFVRAHFKPITERTTNPAARAATVLDWLLWISDLVPSVRAQFASLLDAAQSDEKHEQLAKDIDANTQRTFERPTKQAKEALHYWTQRAEKLLRARDLTSLAEDMYERTLRVEAPELSTVETWIAAGPDRQTEIATAVAKKLRSRTQTECTIDIASFGGPPIATITCGEQSFSLVPGGTFEMGFSEEEEAAVRAASVSNHGCENHFELYEALLEKLDMMRPMTHVRLGPMLVGRGPGEAFPLDKATDVLASSKFRVPSEAEWEYCARGGRARELSYRDDAVPDEQDWFDDMVDRGADDANAFGLWGFGYDPELCADVWFDSHHGVPVDGTPRRGDGPRVVRGGAGQLSPWQAVGEWHMLLNAYRMPSTVWKYEIAMRFVLGIDCGSK